MTTYPLSEAATVYGAKALNDAKSQVIGRGTLEECVDIAAGLSPDLQDTVFIEMDNLELKFGTQEIGELRHFLQEESPGLSNREIIQIKISEP